MTDKMEPVAYTDEVELEAVKDGNGLMWPSPLPNPDGETGLYTADQVKELTDRATTAEAALAEARKVIEPFAKAADWTIEDDDYGTDVAWEHPCAAAVDLNDFRRASAWLQANKGDA
jgi:hypothetical protein